MQTHPATFADARSYERDRVIDCDVCIVGTGAAGVSLALRLQDTDRDVWVLEAGGLEQDPLTTSAYDLEFGGLPISANARQRYFGGTTNTWDGGLAMFRGIDLRPRSWLPLASWPVGSQELADYYRESLNFFGIPHTDLEVRSLSENKGFIFRTSELDAAYVYWSRRPLRFGTRFIAATRNSRNVKTMLYANVTEIVLNPTGTLVERLVVRTTRGRRFFVRPRVTILACGGIENARILLASDRQRPEGIGNEFDQVGRYYMDHPKGRCGTVHLAPSIRRFPHPAYWSGRPRVFRLGVRLSDSAQERYRALNSYIRFRPILEIEGHGTQALRDLARRRWRALGDPRTLRDLLVGFPDALATARFGIWNKGHVRALEIDNFMEQEPRPENRVSLSLKRDLLGTRLSRLEWSISDQDKRTMRILHKALDRDLRRRSMGWVDSPLLSGDSSAWPIQGDASHHIGTTRMGTDPRTSVVDPNCRVHGVENLYIAGSSVFPTSGYANPTLTIVALALRLADHIKRRVLA